MLASCKGNMDVVATRQLDKDTQISHPGPTELLQQAGSPSKASCVPASGQKPP